MNRPSRPSPGGYGLGLPRKRKKRQKGWTKKMDERSHQMIEDSMDKEFYRIKHAAL